MKARRRHSKAAPRRSRRRKNSLYLITGLTILVGLFVIARCAERRLRGPVRIPDGYNAFCIDLSHHNGVVRDWDNLRIHVDDRGRIVEDAEKSAVSYPVTMVYIKATEGETMVDRRFLRNWEEARARRYAVGAYHYYLSDRDPVRQAEHFIRTVGPLRERDLTPVLDVETMHRGCSNRELNAGVRKWLETVEAYYGKKPLIYSSDTFVSRVLDSDLTARYRIWVAHYEVDAPSFPGWSLWQFTDRGHVEGVDGFVDISVER